MVFHAPIWRRDLSYYTFTEYFLFEADVKLHRAPCGNPRDWRYHGIVLLGLQARRASPVSGPSSKVVKLDLAIIYGSRLWLS